MAALPLITGYTSATPATNDIVPFVAVADHTMSSAGTTKQTTVANLLAGATVIDGVTVSGTPSAGQVLTATSSSAANWQAGSGGGGLSLTQTAVQTSTYSASANQLVPVDATGGNVTVNLPSAPAAGSLAAVKMIATASGHTTSVAAQGTDVFNRTAGFTSGTAFSTSLTLNLANQGAMLLYTALSGQHNVTATSASPAVFTITSASNTYAAGQVVYLTGTAPTGFTANTNYYVVSPANSGGNFTFQLAATAGGTAINSSSSGSSLVVQIPGNWTVLSDDLPLGQLDERYGATVSSATWSGSSATVNAATAQVWNITLGNASTAVTLTAAPFASTVAQTITLYLSQPPSGGVYNYSATWSGVTWFGGSAPPITTGASALTVVTFETLNGGSTWYGAVISNAAAPLPVADGGTGLVTLSPYQALIGGTSGTAAVQQQALTGKPPVAYATTAILPNSPAYSAGVLTSGSHAALGTIDGQTPSVSDRVLVKNEAGGGGSGAANNGIYRVTSLGSGSTNWTLTRDADMTDPSQVPGAIVSVQSGTANAGLTYVVANAGPFTFGSTAINWAQLGGGVTLDSTSSDIQPAGQSASAGSSSLAPKADHVHPPGSSFLCTPTQYAPGTLATKDVSSTTFAAFDSTNINTGSFTAPASGSVVVTFSGVALAGTNTMTFALGLSAHGSAGTLYGNQYTLTGGSTVNQSLLAVTFLVTGLTPGNSYNFDLVGATAAAAVLHLKCQGTTSTTIASGGGAPAVLTVQGV